MRAIHPTALCVALVTGTQALAPSPSLADDALVLYSNDFEEGVGSEWSPARTDTSPVLGRRFLGQFQTDDVRLTLTDLPLNLGPELTVEFDLFVIGAWDGNQPGPGPSLWDVSVEGGPRLLRTTFSNIDGHAGLHFNQSYPDAYPDGDHAPYTDAAERNTMGFQYAGDLMDAVYRLSFTFPTRGTSLTLKFWSSLEYYGIDNIVVRGTRSLSAEISPASPRCVDLVVTNAESIRGGEVGLLYDADVVSLVSVRPGLDFPPGGDIQVELDAPNHCPGESGAQAGFTVGWINSLSGDSPTAPGRHRIARICFRLVEGAEIGTCAPLEFVECLGVAEAPVRNIATDMESRSRELETRDGEVCVQGDLPLRRGDANNDGSFDISDPIFVLSCLFSGTDCPECQDAADSNDDGEMNIADPVYLLNWRFDAGSPPPDPFSACGLDPTEDSLEECATYPPCQ